MTTGILLLNLGGPDSLGAVRPFLFNLFSDRDIIRLGPGPLQKPLAALIAALRGRKTREYYRLIGGKSPLLEITQAQADALEEALKPLVSREGAARPLKVYVGMRYWKPFIETAVARMHSDGVRRVLALSLYPQYSVATTGSSVRKFKDVVSGFPMDHVCMTSWFDHPLYIEALAERIREGLAWFEKPPVVLFSAHSLPQKFIDEGDPYAKETEGTIAAVTRKLDIDWRLSYQSKTGPVKWLEPTTEHMLRELAGQGVKDLLVVPISFVSDHIETLYEIDILYKEMAAGLGVTLKRARSLNTSERFVRALADMVVNALQREKWL